MRLKRAKIILSDQQRLRFQTISQKNSAAQPLVLRAKIILLAEELRDSKAVAMELNVSAQLVDRWCHHWNDLIAKNSIEDCLSDAKRSGAPPEISAKKSAPSESCIMKSTRSR